MSRGFPHHSRPGHYGSDFPKELQGWVGEVASAFFPGSEGYPTGRQAQVAHFVAERASNEDVRTLSAIAERYPAEDVSGAVASLTSMERDDSVSFLYLRELLTHGYYASKRVLAAMVDRGYSYHGAPQPLGYPRSEELLIPSETRGSYIPTEEVSRVAH